MIVMIKRYGKSMDMKSIKRELNDISHLIDDCRTNANKYDMGNRVKRDVCICCGSKNRTLFLTAYNQYNYFECQECGALTLEQYPNPKEMYSSESSENLNIYIDQSVHENRIKVIAKPKADFVLEILREHGVRPKKWLDIGCGGAELLHYLKKEKDDIDAIGLETDKAEVSFARSIGISVYDKFIDTENEDKEITDLISNQDVVSFFNVLEHVEKPVEYIDYLYRSMKSSAWLVFEVPKHPSLGSFANLTSDNRIYRHIIPPIHLQIFSEKSINTMLEERFNIAATWEFGQGFMDVINNAMLVSGVKESKLYDLVLQKQNDIQKAIDSSGLADQILVIARKVK